MRTLIKHMDNIMMGLVTRCQNFIIKRAVTATANKLKQLDARDYIAGAEAIANNIYLEFADARRERFFVFHVDISGRIIERQLVSIGTIDTATAYVREIARRALITDAAGIILAHTHIANESEPSEGDIAVTKHIQKALTTIDILVYDHIIVSKAGYFSFREEDIL